MTPNDSPSAPEGTLRCQDASADRDGWTALCREAGSPFHTAEFCDVVQRHWPGADKPAHVACYAGASCRGVLPAFLYGRCSRLDYYRHNVVPPLEGAVIGAHALVVWYGGPVAADRDALGRMLQMHLDHCRNARAVSVLFGIDGRDMDTLEALAGAGYIVGRLQTNTVLRLSAAHQRDPLAELKKPERSERRRVMRRAQEAGLMLAIVRPSEALMHSELIRSSLRRYGLTDDVLPADFVRAVLEANPPGLEVLLAMTPQGRAAGISLNFRWRDAYYLWLSGNEPEFSKPYYPSDFLYQSAITRAAGFGLREIQGGRSPYRIKFDYGFRCVPIMCAIHPAATGDRNRLADWLAAQEARHLALYPEVAV